MSYIKHNFLNSLSHVFHQISVIGLFLMTAQWIIVSCKIILTHWGQVTHICVSDLTIIGSDNGLSPGWRQAIIRTNTGILLIRPLGTNFSEFLVEILIFSFKKMRLKVPSAKRLPFCLGLNELIWLWLPACRTWSWTGHDKLTFAVLSSQQSDTNKVSRLPDWGRLTFQAQNVLLSCDRNGFL